METLAIVAAMVLWKALIKALVMTAAIVLALLIFHLVSSASK